MDEVAPWPKEDTPDTDCKEREDAGVYDAPY